MSLFLDELFDDAHNFSLLLIKKSKNGDFDLIWSDTQIIRPKWSPKKGINSISPLSKKLWASSNEIKSLILSKIKFQKRHLELRISVREGVMSIFKWKKNKNRWSFLDIPGKWYKIDPPMINYVSGKIHAMSSLGCLFSLYILMWDLMLNEHDAHQCPHKCMRITTSVTDPRNSETANKVQKQRNSFFFWHFLKKNIFPYQIITDNIGRFMRDTDKSKRWFYCDMIWYSNNSSKVKSKKKNLELHIPIIEEVMSIIKWNKIADLVQNQVSKKASRTPFEKELWAGKKNRWSFLVNSR